MSELLECRERLESAHKQMQEAMTELITNKNYSARCRQAYARSDRRYGWDRHQIRFMDMICRPRPGDEISSMPGLI